MRYLRLGLIIAVAVTSVGWNTDVAAQLATERFIPVGRSPGLSGQYTLIGEVTAVDAQARTVTVRGNAETRTIRITDETRIWLDRSQLEETNLVGWSPNTSSCTTRPDAERGSRSGGCRMNEPALRPISSCRGTARLPSSFRSTP